MKKAFTLIELLIVVAIIAILAAIAVPNFLEAQVRAKVARGKSDMRSMATGLEAYAVDYNCYPYCNNFGLCGARFSPDERSSVAVNEPRRVLERVSTPIAYMTNGFMLDTFNPTGRRSSFTSANPQGNFTDGMNPLDQNFDLYKFVKYGAINEPGFIDVEAIGTEGKASAWVLQSSGPNRVYANISPLLSLNDEALLNKQIYDPTNGTVSYGYIFRKSGAMSNFGARFMTQIPN